MTFSIPFPAIPIKLTVGKEKKEDAPVVKASPAAQPEAAFDGKDIALVCVSVVAIVAMIVILIVALRQGAAS